MSDNLSYKNRVQTSSIETQVEYTQVIPEGLAKERAYIKALEAASQALNDAVRIFTEESNVRSSNNERHIARLIEMIPSAKNKLIPDYKERLDELILRNENIKNKMDTHVFEGRCKWISFKKEHVHEMDSLEKLIKDFTIE